MEFEVSYDFENEQQFWDELEEILSKDCEGHILIDDALRSYLGLTAEFREQYVNSDHDVTRCAHELLHSTLFEKHGEYIRKQIVHCLLEDDNPDVLQITATFLLADAKETELTFELMNTEGAFTRLVDLIADPKRDDEQGLDRLLMELLYEMARIQRIKVDELMHVQDDFVRRLFHIIEELSDDVNDPYHYPVIRVLLVLNEQFMVAAHDPSQSGSSPPLTNKVIKILSSEGNKYKTFGENIILLLNRESETSLQLLTLKLLYLLFTTPPTQEYFYTNDLRVLVDILIRNLLDLPEEAAALRHTYLRVLYPLLARTQLRYPPQYKREEIRKLLAVLVRGQITETEVGGSTSGHWRYFEDVDDTTTRLVHRCQKVAWLADAETDKASQAESPITETTPTSPTSPTRVGDVPPALPAPRKLTKRNSTKSSGLSVAPYLIPQLPSACSSTLSIVELTAHKEKPGIITPSRKDTVPGTAEKRAKPALPRARRSGWGRSKSEKYGSSTGELSEKNGDVPEGEPGTGPAAFESPVERVHSEPMPDMQTGTIPTVTVSPPHKKPPPAPKTRRWRGKHAKEEDEGGGALRNVRFRSVAVTNSPPTLNTDSSTPEKPLSVAEVGWPKESVSSALDGAQAEAISSLSETLEKATLDQSGDVAPRIVLAPPSPAPPRSVPGPRFELERSPFLADEDEEDV